MDLAALLGLLQSSDPGDRDRGQTEARRMGFKLALSREAMVPPALLPRSRIESSPQPQPQPQPQSDCDSVVVIDNAVPDSLLSTLDRVFQPASPFLASKGYGEHSAFFSFAFNPSLPPSNIVEQVIVTYLAPLILPRLKGKKLVTCEWWVHARERHSGHQMHWDTNESRITQGQGVHHPVASSVLVINPGAGNQPLLVANQTFGTPASEAVNGWLVSPSRPGRLVAFDGELLHGVVPQFHGNPSAAGSGLRVTLMTGWWAFDTLEPTPRHGRPGPNRALRLQEHWGLSSLASLPRPPQPTAAPQAIARVGQVWTLLAKPTSKRARAPQQEQEEFIRWGGYLLTSPKQIQEEIELAGSKGVAAQTRKVLGEGVQAAHIAEFARVAAEHPDEVGLSVCSDAAFLRTWTDYARHPSTQAPALVVLWAACRHATQTGIAQQLSRGHQPLSTGITAMALVMAWCFVGRAEDTAAALAWFEATNGIEALFAGLSSGGEDDYALEALIEMAASAPPRLSNRVTALFG